MIVYTFIEIDSSFLFLVNKLQCSIDEGKQCIKFHMCYIAVCPGQNRSPEFKYVSALDIQVALSIRVHSETKVSRNHGQTLRKFQ